MATGRPRGHTTSSIYRPAQYSSASASITSPLSRVISSPSAPGLDGLEEPQEREFDGVLKSSFRLRSRSQSCSPAQRFIGETLKEEDENKENNSPNLSPSAWLDGKDVDEFLLEPWTAPPGKDMIPDDLQQDWEDTRDVCITASTFNSCFTYLPCSACLKGFDSCYGRHKGAGPPSSCHQC